MYDAGCLWSKADDFSLAQVDEIPASRVLDLGCGTGRLTIGIANASHATVGMDPAKASIDAAKGKPGASQVEWIVGTAARTPPAVFDVVVMTSHVAQFMVTDEEWNSTLASLVRTLTPGGRLIFDSRDPSYRQSEKWNPFVSRRTNPTDS